MSEFGCGCHRCEVGRAKAGTRAWYAPYSVGMIVCPECGNKRCPRATWHGNECTGSNEPDQPGSRYGGLSDPLPALSAAIINAHRAAIEGVVEKIAEDVREGS